MDWLKLFTLLVAVASLYVTAEGAKKKIRIHLPQKVKHIHHHKKIYITNHPASSQYAPAYMPSAEGAMAVPTSVALPPLGLMPLSVDSFEAPRPPSAAATQIVPLYRARGYYGPQTSQIDNDYDLAPPPESAESSYLPQSSTYPEPNYSQKKIKIFKVNSEQPRKKPPPRKTKSKQRAPRPKPQSQEDELPVSNFHEQFYSDLDGSGTIKKIRRPHRVEKIIDGDTEHIHTFSEEHIHKLVYNDGRVDSVSGMSGLIGHAQPLGRFKNSQAFLPYPSNHQAALGSMGTPSHLEYMAYNPREVTHDHIFHDHGEIPSNVDITRDQILHPPRVSYNSQGVIREGGNDNKNFKKYNSHKYTKLQKGYNNNDYSYYENMYSQYNRPTATPRPTNPTSYYGNHNLDGYKPVPSFKDYGQIHSAGPPLYFGNEKQVTNYGQKTNSAPSPFGMSSTVVHDYKPKTFGRTTPLHASPLHKFKDPLQNFKDHSYTNNFDFDAFASDVYTAENNIKTPPPIFPVKKGKKKSFSTQNISFGGLDHQTKVDHLGGLQFSANDESSLNYNSYNNFDQNTGFEAATSTPYTIRESSPAHSYYSAMAAKALQSDPLSVGEASNDHFQYVEGPSSTTEAPLIPSTTTMLVYQDSDTEPIPTETIEFIEVRPVETKLVSQKNNNYPSVFDIGEKKRKNAKRPLHHSLRTFKQDDTPRLTGSLKYGDRI